jgi:hypothetical protein
VLIGAGLVVFMVGRQARRDHDLTRQAQAYEQAATDLRNKAARIRASQDKLDAEAREAEAGALDNQAADLANRAAFLRRAKPIPSQQMANEFTGKANALRDSAARIRADLQARDVPLTAAQQRLLSQIERDAEELQIQAQLLNKKSNATRDQVESYNQCILIYGEGSARCEQLRK